jgi:hypothetical protein
MYNYVILEEWITKNITYIFTAVKISIWKVLKCGAGGWKRSVGPII